MAYHRYCSSLALLFVLVASSALLALAVRHVRWRQRLPNRCDMTYMLPSYHLENSSRGNDDVPPERSLASSRHYALYLYREGHVRQRRGGAGGASGVEERRIRAGNTPVLFVPGNAGSFRQVRSLARESDSLAPHLDWYTVDLNDELSALSGGLLRAHTDYVARCVRHLLWKYDTLQPASSADSAPARLVIVAHSMGGIVARAVLTAPLTKSAIRAATDATTTTTGVSSANDSSSFSSSSTTTRASIPPSLQSFLGSRIPLILTLNTPHAAPVALLSKSLQQFYEQLEDGVAANDQKLDAAEVPVGANTSSPSSPAVTQYRHSAARTAIVSISSAAADQLVPPALTASPWPSVITWSQLSTLMRDVHVAADHLCVLWCNQLVRALTKAMHHALPAAIAAAPSATPPTTSPSTAPSQPTSLPLTPLDIADRLAAALEDTALQRFFYSQHGRAQLSASPSLHDVTSPSASSTSAFAPSHLSSARTIAVDDVTSFRGDANVSLHWSLVRAHENTAASMRRECSFHLVSNAVSAFSAFCGHGGEANIQLRALDAHTRTWAVLARDRCAVLGASGLVALVLTADELAAYDELLLTWTATATTSKDVVVVRTEVTSSRWSVDLRSLSFWRMLLGVEAPLSGPRLFHHVTLPSWTSPLTPLWLQVSERSSSGGEKQRFALSPAVVLLQSSRVHAFDRALLLPDEERVSDRAWLLQAYGAVPDTFNDLVNTSTHEFLAAPPAFSLVSWTDASASLDASPSVSSSQSLTLRLDFGAAATTLIHRYGTMVLPAAHALLLFAQALFPFLLHTPASDAASPLTPADSPRFNAWSSPFACSFAALPLLLSFSHYAAHPPSLSLPFGCPPTLALYVLFALALSVLFALRLALAIWQVVLSTLTLPLRTRFWRHANGGPLLALLCIVHSSVAFACAALLVTPATLFPRTWSQRVRVALCALIQAPALIVFARELLSLPSGFWWLSALSSLSFLWHDSHFFYAIFVLLPWKLNVRGIADSATFRSAVYLMLCVWQLSRVFDAPWRTLPVAALASLVESMD